MKTLHPETEVIASRVDGDAFVYTVLRNGVPVEVRVLKSAFAGIPEGALGMVQRRTVLANAVRMA